jgi:mxaJ protein
MCLGCREFSPSPPCAALMAVLVALSGCARSSATRASQSATEPSRVLRISADPNNLPFTNEKRQGFENKIAELLAADLNASIEYHWRAQRRGFFRHALKENECDLVLGVPYGFERALTTLPYYRSMYCFVSRADRGLDIRSLDDSSLRQLRIGVQMVGDDGANTPPAHALASRGIVQNVVGYTLYGDYRDDTPPSRIIDAVEKGDIDIAIVWGPLAGYFAKQRPGTLKVVPVSPQQDRISGLPFAFDIAMGCRKPDKSLCDEIQAVLHERQADIQGILDEYGVPRLPISTRASKPAGGDDEDND